MTYIFGSNLETASSSRRRGYRILVAFIALLFPLFSLGYATGANEVLEEWPFNDASGVALDQTTNVAGAAAWNTSAFLTDGLGRLMVANGGDDWNRSAALPRVLPPGLYEVEWHISAMDLSHSSATDNCGMTLDLGGSMHVRLFAFGGSDLAITLTGGPGGWTRVRTFSGRTLSDLTLRTVYDTVAHTAVIYSTLGPEPEQQSATYPITDVDISALNGHFLAGNMHALDYLSLDDITLTMLDVDTDSDGLFDGSDPDDDNDGYLDGDDAFPKDWTEWADENGNGVGDNVQFDQGVLDEFYNKFGTLLSAEQHDILAKAVKPFFKETWRINAAARIDLHRKTDIAVQVVDSGGIPVPGAQVHLDLTQKEFLFGAALPTKKVIGTETYPGITTERFRELILDFCDAIGANNAFKPRLHSFFEWTLPDFLAWAGTNNLPVRGHLLMWPTQNGGHLPFSNPYNISNAWAAAEANPSPPNINALRDVVDFQIADWAGKYAVTQWDVINENSDGNVLTNLLGEQCVADWFNNAATNRLNPDTELFINDYSMISGDRSQGYIAAKVARCKELLSYLQSNNAPLDGMGVQSHFGSYHVLPEEIYARLDEFAAYNLNLVGTEFDLADELPAADKTARTAEIMTEYFSHPAVSQFLTWHFVDETPRALVSTNGLPNLHGLAWYYLSRIAWNTETNQLTDAAGEVFVRCFKGDYDMTVSFDGKEYPAALTLVSNQTVVVTLADVDLPEWFYRDWLALYPALGSSTNRTDNPDGDRLNNLTEYAQGGDPANGAHTGYAPLNTMLEADGTNSFEYVYAQRNDAQARGLIYSLEQSTNLVSGVWSQGPIDVLGIGVLDAEFDAVTNRIPALGEEQGFLRLQIKMQ